MVECCFCGWNGESFLAFNGLPNRLCPECHSLERHRAVAKYFADISFEGLRVLEIAPLTPLIFGKYLGSRGARYVSLDRWRGGNPVDPRDVSFIDTEMDLAALGFGNLSFDVVIAQHVLCQVSDDTLALLEIARVLTEKGFAIIEFPHDPQKRQTEEYAEQKEWGNYRRYGRDVEDKLEQSGFEFCEVGFDLGSFFVCTRA